MAYFLRLFDWRVAAALAATCLFFGSGPAAAAAGIKSLPPFLMVACRGLIAGVILIVWALADGTPGPSWREWCGSATIGVLILACGAGGGTYGQLTIPSGVAGVLSALLPLIAAVIGYFFFSEKLPIRAVAGLIIGFAGIGLLLRPGSGFDVFGVTIICGGQVAWAAGAELAPRLGLPEEPRLAAGLELLTGGAVLLTVASALGDRGRLDLAEVSPVSWMGFAWFIIIAVGGFTAFGYPLTNCCSFDRDNLFIRQPDRGDDTWLDAVRRTDHLADGDRDPGDRHRCVCHRLDEVGRPVKD